MSKLSKQVVEKRFAQFGLILLDEYTHSFSKVAIKCKCSKVFYSTPHSVFIGDCKSCGCYRKEITSLTGKQNILKGPFSNRWEGYKNISSTYFTQLKTNAINRNLDFSITIEDLQYLLEKQLFYCNMSNIKLITENNVIITGSIDRIDNNKGYTIDNIQWVHKDINYIKNDFSSKEIVDLCNLVTKPFPLQNNPAIYETIQHKNFKGYKSLPLNIYSSIRRNAISRKLDFNISIEDMWNLYIKQQGCCHLTHLPLYFHNRSLYGNASLDRINNNLGYTKDNIQWLHKNINLMKWTFSLKEFIDYCNRISMRHKKIGICSGYFDPYHIGHKSLIEQSKSLCDYLIVIVNNDKQAKQKKNYSLLNESHRIEIIQSLKSVDETILSIDTNRTVNETIKMIRNRFPLNDMIFFNGGDVSFCQEQDICKELSITTMFKIGGEVKTISSSEIIRNAYLSYTKQLDCGDG